MEGLFWHGHCVVGSTGGRMPASSTFWGWTDISFTVFKVVVGYVPYVCERVSALPWQRES